MDDLHCDRDAEFHLLLAIEALQGINEALYDLMGDMPRSGAALSHWTASVAGLAWAGMRIAQETNHFIDRASNGASFPTRFDDLKATP